MVARCTASAEQVMAQVNLSVFWSDFMACLQNGGFGETTAEVKRFMRGQWKWSDHPLNAPGQPPWKAWIIYLEPDGLLGALEQYLKRQGRTMTLKRQDLVSQMQQKPYWIKQPRGMMRQRFEGAGSQACWGIALDYFPELGYRYVPDEELAADRETQVEQHKAAAKAAEPAVFFHAAEFGPESPWERDTYVDPRKGALFNVVGRLG